MKASVKHIRISPKKANLVAGIVRGKKATEALSFLKLANKKGADILYKVLASAVANAENNDGKSKDSLLIESIVVTKGRTLRRGIPASRGRVMPIKKRSSHLFVYLREAAHNPESTNTKRVEAPKAESNPPKKAPSAQKTAQK
jgi:large subunit ribosomal protein L22